MGLIAPNVDIIASFYATGALFDGVTDDTAAILAAITAAKNSSTINKRVVLPVGTARISVSSGVLFDLGTAVGVEVVGQGAGKTILQVPANTVLSGDVTIFRLGGNSQRVSDLSISIGAGMSGAFDLRAVELYSGGFWQVVRNMSIRGIYGNGTSGGAGVATYQQWNVLVVNTTVGGAVASGSQVVTPPSMAGIYVGQRLTIGGSTEEVIVTAKTETTFTATFANTHTNANTITAYSYGHQYATIDNVYVYDSYKATAFVINSSANVLRNCRTINVGSSTAQHGFYIQGGRNVFDTCYVEGARGYSYHANAASGLLDMSGNQFTNCTSIDPGFQHMIATSSYTGTTNNDLVSGVNTARYTSLTACLFRRTKGAASCAGVQIVNGATIVGCEFEDAIDGANNVLFFTGGGQSIVADNHFRTYQTPASNIVFITAIADAIIHDNQFVNMPGGSVGVNANAACDIHDNVFSAAASAAVSGVALLANNVTVHHNKFNLNGGQAVNSYATVYSNFRCTENTITQSVAAHGIYFQPGCTPSSGLVAGNIGDANSPLRYSTANSALVVKDNSMPYQFGSGAVGGIVDAASGRHLCLPKGTNTLTEKLLVKLDSAGLVATVGTADTTFVAMATATAAATSANVYVAGQVGSEIVIACDGAWTAGHYGQISTTVAGKIHDTGSFTAPASGSYIYFLDTGATAGNARALVMRTV